MAGFEVHKLQGRVKEGSSALGRNRREAAHYPPDLVIVKDRRITFDVRRDAYVASRRTL